MWNSLLLMMYSFTFPLHQAVKHCLGIKQIQFTVNAFFHAEPGWNWRNSDKCCEWLTGMVAIEYREKKQKVSKFSVKVGNQL